MKEIFKKTRNISVALAITLGSVAVFESEANANNSKVHKEKVVHEVFDGIGSTFYQNGSVIINSTKSTVNSFSQYDPLQEFCEGTMLVVRSLDQLSQNINYNNGIGSTGVTVVPNFSGCIDGKLTPSDFSLSIPKINHTN